MSKKFEQDRYDKWDKNFNKWEDDYYSPTDEDKQENDNNESREHTRD